MSALAIHPREILTEGGMEQRAWPVEGIEVRDPTQSYDNTWMFSGYAAVFGVTTTLYQGRFLRVTEEIDPGAFDAVLRDQSMRGRDGVVHFNISHDMSRAMAATDVPAGQAGSLELRADPKGLHYVARASKDDPDAQGLAVKTRAGVVKQASFMFTIKRAEWTDTETDDGQPDVSHRRVLEIGHLYDVCACAQGAFSDASSELHARFASKFAPFDGTSEAEIAARLSAERSGVVASTTKRTPIEALLGSSGRVHRSHK